MSQLHLIATEYNFHWPGKIQSLIHRIYEYQKMQAEQFFDRRGNDIHPQMKDAISHWARRCFSGPEFISFEVKFERPLYSYEAFGRESLILHFEIIRNLRYTITVNFGRSIDECCDIHSHAERWKRTGANIFDIKYVNEIYVTDPDGQQRLVHGLGAWEDLPASKLYYHNNSYLGSSHIMDLQMDPGFSSAYIKPELEFQDQVLEKVKSKEEPKKVNTEFENLKNKISEMSSFAKDDWNI